MYILYTAAGYGQNVIMFTSAHVNNDIRQLIAET